MSRGPLPARRIPFVPLEHEIAAVWQAPICERVLTSLSRSLRYRRATMVYAVRGELTRYIMSGGYACVV